MKFRATCSVSIIERTSSMFFVAEKKGNEPKELSAFDFSKGGREGGDEEGGR